MMRSICSVAGTLLLLSGLSACAPKATDSSVTTTASDNTIVGGKTVKKNSDAANRVVMISTDTDDNETILCTGTFIAENLILTAAHCVNTNPQLMTLTFSPRPFEDSDAVYLSVDKVVIYPKSDSERHDLAIVRFDGGFPPGAVVTNLPNQDFSLVSGAKFIALGYGRTDGVDADGTVEFIGAGVLRAVTLSTFDFQSRKPTFTVNQESGKGVCFGDSGGPAMGRTADKQMVIMGIASGVFDSPEADVSLQGFDSCKQRSMYINVVKYLGWIQKTKAKLSKN